jgi:ketosteroid isomerase-like protein
MQNILTTKLRFRIVRCMNYLAAEATDVDHVVTLYRALADGDVAGAAATLDDDVVLHVPGTHPLAGDHRGPDAVLGFVAATRARTDDAEQIEVLDVLAGERYVAVAARVHATRAGRAPLDNRTVHVLRLDAGRVAEIWLHNFDDLTVSEFWS